MGFYAPPSSSINITNSLVSQNQVIVSLITINLNLLNTYYIQFLQINLAIAIALLGLFGLIFIEIIKAIDSRAELYNRTWITKYLLLGFSIITVGLLVYAIGFTYTSTALYHNLVDATTTYLTYYNYSNYKNVSFTLILVNKTRVNASVLFAAQNSFITSTDNNVTNYVQWGMFAFAITLGTYFVFIASTQKIPQTKRIKRRVLLETLPSNKAK